MILDAELLLSNAQAITVTAPSTNVIDVAGLGVGVPVTNLRYGVQDASFGEDIGGGGPLASAPQIYARVGNAFTAGGAGTLQVQLQAAVDTNNTGTPGTWDTLIETDAYVVALLTAGQKIGDFTIPRRYPGQGFPRFYRLNYVVSTGPMLTGTVNASISTGIDEAALYPSAF